MPRGKMRWTKFWYQDWLGEGSLQRVSLAAEGAWHRAWCMMLDQDSCRITCTPEQWAGAWRVGSAEALAIIDELRREKVCLVTFRAGKVTLTSRRLKRTHKARLRKQKSRSKVMSRECHGKSTETRVPEARGYVPSTVLGEFLKVANGTGVPVRYVLDKLEEIGDPQFVLAALLTVKKDLNDGKAIKSKGGYFKTVCRIGNKLPGALLDRAAILIYQATEPTDSKKRRVLEELRAAAEEERRKGGGK